MKDEQNNIDDGLKELLRRAKANKKKQTVDVSDENTELLSAASIPTSDTKAKTKKTSSDEKAKRAFKQLTGWDDNESVNVSLRTIIGGDILAGRWLRHHLSFIFFLVFLAILYVTNRYQHQQEMIDNRKLILQLEDRRLRSVVATSNLTEYTRRSNISTQLPDTTLKSSPEPFYYLQTSN